MNAKPSVDKSGQVMTVLENLMKEFGDMETGAVVMCEVVRKINSTTNRQAWSTVLEDDLAERIVDYERKLAFAGGRDTALVLHCLDKMLDLADSIWLQKDSFARKLVSNRKEAIALYFRDRIGERHDENVQVDQR